MPTTEEKAIALLREAYVLLLQLFTDARGRGVTLADAIDHTGAALRSLGVDTDTIERK